MQCSNCLTTLPTMNYGKKDEDADTGLVKVDRTQVFQEGESAIDHTVSLVGAAAMLIS